VDAKPALVEIGRVLGELNFEAILIGNAAAALQGAPVTTIDFDFLFRKTPRNLAKLKTLAGRLNATVLRPYYPVSDLYRVTREDDGLQIDFIWLCSRSWRRRLKKPTAGTTRRKKLAAVARESERGLREQIRRWQALPPERRTHFLRKRLGWRRTVL
jgi:hypothetical protein